MKMKNKKMLSLISALGVTTMLFTGCGSPQVRDDEKDRKRNGTTVIPAHTINSGKSTTTKSGIFSPHGSTGIGSSHGGVVS